MAIQGLTPERLQAAAPDLLDLSHARRLVGHVLHHGHDDLAVRDFSRARVASLGARFHVPSLAVVERRRSPRDGFVKYLFRLADGAQIEAVRIPLFDTKYVVCVSSQVGCALGCVFCATGRMGFVRDLEPWEIVEQVRTIRREADRPVRGVVFMGMGEPLLNYEGVIAAAYAMSDPSSLAIAKKAITISTAGVVPAIRRFTDEGHDFRLAVSLTAGTHEKRRALMPIERKWPIEELIESVRAYATATGNRVTLEYVAIAGVNCGADDATALAALLRGISIRFNLIEVNDAGGEFSPPDAAELAAFRDALQVLGQPIVRRYSGGKDVQAACGMLAATSDGGQLLG
ncbi:MAG: radical SAM protein [Myxococcales bacterium]|nr:radical SAM protein [Myxococcales bacterium]